ncbi:hypothetical protein PoB_004759800 [Plakobranchus ocellatus]|uniref:Uncharacterized protein n=1 Tax=Plakobranchus ocellatus TaxID=259542 RepID=A0AAV4BPQ3_9GAST|nr:hypothetical protein PoB_004759800 [Plakobranchus ocellatus]
MVHGSARLATRLGGERRGEQTSRQEKRRAIIIISVRGSSTVKRRRGRDGILGSLGKRMYTCQSPGVNPGAFRNKLDT